MTPAIPRCWQAARGDICARRVEAEPKLYGRALDDLVMLEASWSERQVGLTPREIDVALIGDELDRELRGLCEKRSEKAREHARDEPLGSGDSHDSAKALITPRDTALDRQRVLLHALAFSSTSAPAFERTKPSERLTKSFAPRRRSRAPMRRPTVG